ILTPLLPYFPLIIVFAQRYEKNAGIGSIVAIMLPFSIVFGIVSTLALVLWIFFGIPLGPEAPLDYVAP
ncbi:MAG: AbgT family transporter, partial [Bacteroidetes bacterium]|nr:AbgT family transporter [Bacteroidota bacterium]